MDGNTIRPGGGLGTGQSHLLGWALGDVDESALSTTSPGGAWQIETLSLNDIVATLGLRERKTAVETKLPKNEYDLTTYPNMDINSVGKSIPIGFGVVLGAEATLINSTTSRFKFLDHSVTSIQRFYLSDGTFFTPDSIDLDNSEFTYTAWDGAETLYVNYTADLDNPVDAAKELLIGTTRGASLPAGNINQSSTGEGFGTLGARTHYIRGTIPGTTTEVPLYEMSFHISEPTPIKNILDEIQAACFGFIYIDFDGKWTFRPWKPVPGDGLDEITENNVIGELQPRASIAESATKAIVKYNVNPALDSEKRYVFQRDDLRQLRRLTAHTVIEKTLPISNSEGAVDWAQKTVATRGRPRRIFKFRGTSELKLARPGDYIRLNYSPANINEIVLITKVSKTPGEIAVNIECIDGFGFRDRVGFWTADGPLTFPAALGGGSLADWDDADTTEKQQWVRENKGFWLLDNGYADEADPDLGFRVNVWW